MILNKLIVIAILLYSGAIFGQESNCPEPKKKAMKYFNAAKSGSTAERKKLLYEAIKADPNFLEAYDELSNICEKEADRAFNAGNVRGFQQQEGIKLKHWKKINEICPDYRNFYFAIQLGDLYFGQRKFIEAKPYYQQVLSSPNAFKKDERVQ